MIYSFFPALYLFTAGVMDIRRRRIDNCWIAFGLVSGFVFSMSGAGAVEPAQSLAGLGLGAVSVILFLFRALGAGDVKLLMVFGCLTGTRGLERALIPMIFCAGILMAVYRLIDMRGQNEALIKNGKMPLAPAMFMGYIVSAVNTDVIRELCVNGFTK